MIQRLIKLKKKIFWGKTNRKYSKTKRTLENVKISWTTKQKKSLTNTYINNKESFSFDSLLIEKTFKNITHHLREMLLWDCQNH